MKTSTDVLYSAEKELSEKALELATKDAADSVHPGDHSPTPGELDLRGCRDHLHRQLVAAQDTELLMARAENTRLRRTQDNIENGAYEDIPDTHRQSPSLGAYLLPAGVLGAVETFALQPAIATVLATETTESWMIAAVVGAGSVGLAHLAAEAPTPGQAPLTHQERQWQRGLAQLALAGLAGVWGLGVFGRVAAAQTAANLGVDSFSWMQQGLFFIAFQTVFVVAALALAGRHARLGREADARSREHYLADVHGAIGDNEQLVDGADERADEQRETLDDAAREAAITYRTGLARSEELPMDWRVAWGRRTRDELRRGVLFARIFPGMPIRPHEELDDIAEPATVDGEASTQGPEVPEPDQPSNPDPHSPTRASQAPPPDPFIEAEHDRDQEWSAAPEGEAEEADDIDRLAG